MDREPYRKALDDLSFSDDFQARTEALLRDRARDMEKERNMTKFGATKKTVLLAAAMAALPAVSVSAAVLWLSPSQVAEHVEEPLLAQLGKKYGKSSAQIILRWHIQDGNIVIPGSKNPAHIKDNFDLFDFALTEDEMSAIAALDKQVRYYTSTPEQLAKYAQMVPPVDEQK